MTAMSLTGLANLYGTDKGTVGPSPDWGARNYTDIYAAYMEGNRYSTLSILEIGLGVVGDQWDSQIVHGQNTGGASLKMWYDYFPNSRIFGIDVNPCPYLDNDRIRTFVADQGSVHDLEKFSAATAGMQFDIIIDDGSHRPDHQQISLSFLFRKLKKGGLYFIEDLQCNGLGDGVTGRHACDEVRNTRSVLKNFRDSGKFLEPNALMDSAYLAQNIAYLNFHIPEVTFEITQVTSLPPTFKTTMHYNLDRELMCAIYKR